MHSISSSGPLRLMSAHRRTLLLAVAVAVAGCSKSGTTDSTPTDTFGGSATTTSFNVTMPDVVFVPNHVDIARGGTIHFVFASVTHDVRFNGAAGAPADILATTNQTVDRTFNTAGSYAIVCTLHANMTGTVIVH